MHVETVFVSKSVTELIFDEGPAARKSFFSRLASVFAGISQPRACGLIFCGTVVSEELLVGEELIIEAKERRYKGEVLSFNFGHEDKKAIRKGSPVVAVFRCDRPHPNLSTFKGCVLYRTSPDYLKDATQLFTNVPSQAR